MNSNIQRNFWICFRILKYFTSLAKKEYKKFTKLVRTSLKDSKKTKIRILINNKKKTILNNN